MSRKMLTSVETLTVPTLEQWVLRGTRIRGQAPVVRSAFPRRSGPSGEYRVDRGSRFRLLDHSRSPILDICGRGGRRPGGSDHILLRAWPTQPIRNADAFLPKAEGKSRRLVVATYASRQAVSLACQRIAGRHQVLCLTGFTVAPGRLPVNGPCLAVAATAIFTIQDSVLIGLRQAVWVPVENGAFGIAKIGVLFLLAPLGTAFALFGAWMIPLTLTIPVISAVLFFRFLPPAPRPRRTGHLGREIRSRIIRFTIAMPPEAYSPRPGHISCQLSLPLHWARGERAVFHLISLLQHHRSGCRQLRLAIDGRRRSYPDEIPALIRSTLRHIFVIILPAVVALITICPWLLRVFGDKYVARCLCCACC